MFRRWVCFLLSALLILGLPLPAGADNSAQADEYAKQILGYYLNYQQRAETDILYLLDQMAQIDPVKAQVWGQIIDNWTWSYETMAVSQNVLPDGLPEDDSLCIIVLGMSLNGNGTMRDELIARLETALSSAQKYPNAYIVCTGGNNSGARNDPESQVMAQWLAEKGIDPQRIITENESTSTTENILFTYRILSENYPRIRHAAIITSDYHIRRSCMLWNTASIYFSGMGTGNAIPLAGNAVCQTDGIGDEGYLKQAQGVALITGLNFHPPRVPTLTRVKSLTVTGKVHYTFGEPLILTATACYGNGYSRPVSPTVIDFDPWKSGIQTVTLSYTENGNTVTAQFTLILLPGRHVPAPPLPEDLWRYPQTAK